MMELYKIIFGLCFVALISADKFENNDEETQQFLGFIKKFNKKYANVHEYNYRLKVFKDNMKRAAQLQKENKGTATYGATKFADLTLQEFRDSLGLGKDYLSQRAKLQNEAEIPDVALPKYYDWREHGAVTDVKDQSMCGSCWTFSVTGNVEGQYAIKYNELLSFSEQEIVDCDKTNAGCNGGWPSLAMQDIDYMGGLMLEDDYPYTGVDGECYFDKSNAKVKLNGSVSLPVDETAIAKWVYANGPVSICLNADDMQMYTGGISHPSNCDKYMLNHAVLITGFGVKKVNKKKMPYWIIKNSWGTSWGEEGYYRVYRGDGTCGLDLMVASAIVE